MTQPKSQSGRLTAAEISQKNGLSSYIMRTGEWMHDGRVISAIDEALAQQKQEMEQLQREIGEWQARADELNAKANDNSAEIQRMKAVLGEHEWDELGYCLVGCNKHMSVGTHRHVPHCWYAGLLTDAPADSHCLCEFAVDNWDGVRHDRRCSKYMAPAGEDGKR